MLVILNEIAEENLKFLLNEINKNLKEKEILIFYSEITEKNYNYIFELKKKNKNINIILNPFPLSKAQCVNFSVRFSSHKAFLYLYLHDKFPKNFKQLANYVESFNVVHKNIEQFSHDVLIEDLVSITIHNFNYGKFLDKCFSSIFNQSYKNFEVIFSDNNSTDNSLSIAKKYQKKYPKKFTLITNSNNRGPSFNMTNTLYYVKGEFILPMCSDDFLEKNCLELAIKNLKKYNDAGFCLFHRNVADSRGRITKEKPFYDNSYLIPGNQQCGVYMMATVNPSISQIIYRTKAFLLQTPSPNISLDRWFANRIKDFQICSIYKYVIYIAKPLINHREHNQSDSAVTSTNLIEIMGMINLNYFFLDLNQSEIVKTKFNESIKKISSLSLRYSKMNIAINNLNQAKQFLYLSRAIDLEIEKDDQYHKINNLLSKKKISNKDLLDIKKDFTVYKRQISYKPPSGSVKIKP